MNYVFFLLLSAEIIAQAPTSLEDFNFKFKAPEFQTFKPIDLNNSHTHNPFYPDYNPFQNNNILEQQRDQQRQYLLQQQQIYQQQLLARVQAESKATIEKLLQEQQEEKTKEQLSVAKQHYVAYVSSANEIKEMLENKKPLDIKRAVFLVENAYLNNKLSYSHWEKQIAEIIDFCALYMVEVGLDTQQVMYKIEALQSYFSDTIILQNGKSHFPFTYDFEDPLGDKDFTKQFVSKLLKTGKGQCHSMPLLYKIIADEWGIPAFLCFAPNHCYIKYPINNRKYVNFETTNGNITDDAWVLTSGFINEAAIRNGIYLRPINQWESILHCFSDMLTGYETLFGQDATSLQWGIEGLQFKENDISFLIIRANWLTSSLVSQMKSRGVMNVEGIEKYNDLKELKATIEKLYIIIDQMGYKSMSSKEYQEWIQTGK